MSRRRPDDPERGFADALGGVRPLAERDRLRPPPPPREPLPPRAPSRGPRRFAVEATGEELVGRAEGVSRAILDRLRRGDPPPEREVDLHGLAPREAERRLARAILDARRAGERCVLAIHGRGLHSGSPAVLRALLPEWLQATPLAGLVLAFASAPRAQGGAGATLVLLRRERGGAVSSAAPGRGGEHDES